MKSEDDDRGARVLRALSNPLRFRLLTALEGNSPARVSDLAEIVDEPANSVSFHLRELAKAGLVEKAEDVEGATRKESWWRTVDAAALDLDFENLSPQERAEKLPTLRQALTLFALDMTDTLVTALEHEEKPGILGSHMTVELTQEEAAELRERLCEVIDDVTAKAGKHSPGDGARPWTISTSLAPDTRGRIIT